MGEEAATMKALTICQPYAQLIIAGRKTCENRSWPTRHRGLIYIHAGKSEKWMSVENGIEMESGYAVKSFAFGAVVGIARLVDCVNVYDSAIKKYTTAMTSEQRRHVNGEWCWILENAQAVGPWPWRGAQGLFEIDEDELGRLATRMICNG